MPTGGAGLPSETVFILLFVVASAVAIAARRFRIPYTVALVAAGLLLGSLHLFEPPHLTKELLFAVILPGLLFEAAFHIESAEFGRDSASILLLAVPGVALAIALTAGILVEASDSLPGIQGFDWRHALVFGAGIAATDPIAVVGLFRTLGAPRRLAMLVEGESLLNDGTAIVFFTLALGLATGATWSARGLALDFVKVVGAGVLVGGAVGMIVSQVIRNVDDPMIEITLTTLAAYGAFVLAEQFHYSGVIATVTAGMLCGNYGARTGMSPSTRIAAETFWDYVAFALNSIVFLLIGFEVHLHDLIASWPVILLAYGVVTIGRAGVIFAGSAVLRLSREPIPWRWSAVLTWGGLRGALSMVLALSLSPHFPNREAIVTMTFGVVLLSILVQGLTMSPLLRWLGIVERQELRAAYELTRGRLQAAHSALQELERLGRGRLAPRSVVAALREQYEKRMTSLEGEVESLRTKGEHIDQDELHGLKRHLLLVEKERAIELYRHGSLGHDSYEKLLADLDARLVRLESGQPDPDEEPEDARGEPPAGG
jgi:CPA1 family monovalent cation:H+ antiporter